MRVVLLAIVLVTGCGPRIDAVTVPPRVVPERPTTDVRVCWIESERFGPGTVSTLVIRHPDGDVLVDAGTSTNFREEIEVYGGRDRRWFKRLPGLFVPKQPIGDKLRAAGIDPTRLRWFLPTHVHIDHVGGFVQLPATPTLLDAEEVAVVERGRNEVIFDVVPAHAEALSPHVEPIVYQPLAYEIYDRHADLFGDGTVIVVPLHGHTPGSVGVFVNRPDGTRIFHVGDAANERSAIERRRGRRASLRRTDADPRAAAVELARLHELADAAPELTMVPAHERRAWKAAFGRPTKDCK
jgi:N-acyl homoserine lactone hydrolase